MMKRNNKNIRAVLFDLDNTLYDYDVPNKTSLKEVYKVLNKYIKMSHEKFMKLFNLSRREIHRELAGTASSHNRTLYFQKLIEKTKQTVDPKLILKLDDAYWGFMLKTMKLNKGVLQTFKELKRRGIQIGIVSDLTIKIQLRKLDKLKIGDYVDVLITSEEAGSEKPHKIMFLLALNKLDLTPKDVLMVGDRRIADIEGANAVGMETIIIKRGKLTKKPEADSQKADYEINNIPEILNIIDKRK